MFNKFVNKEKLINCLKAKKGIYPILVKGIDPVQTIANGELTFGVGVYHGDVYNEESTRIVNMWLDSSLDLLSQVEDIIRLTRGKSKQSKVGIVIKSFLQ